MDRLADAVAIVPQETARDVSIAAFESANWLDAISSREAIVGDYRIKALLYARGRLRHHWSAGMHFDQALQTWVWYPTANIVVPEDEHHLNLAGERAYERHLAGKPVLEASPMRVGIWESAGRRMADAPGARSVPKRL